LVRVLDPLEMDFKSEKPVLVRDLESGDERFVDSSVMAGSYQRKFQAHRQALESLTASMGIPSVVFKTTDPLELVLSSFLSMREGVGPS
jgi:hypothetical protein